MNYKYVALLRGINVSGQKIIKMEVLKKMFERLNFEQVKTYIQSGNVIFESNILETNKLAERIIEEIEIEFGFQVPVLVKKISELQEIISHNPYSNLNEDELKRLYIVLLKNPAEQFLIEQLNSIDYAPEEFHITEKAIYFYCPSGYGKSKIDNNFFEKKLKVVATTRNWKTMNALASY